MRSKVLLRPLALALTLGAALALGATAQDPPAAGTTTSNTTGVTFVNGSTHHIWVYTRYGEGSCESKPSSQTASLEGGQSVSVDSGSSSVCFCLQVPERRSCPSGWSEVKPGATRHLM
jgi:hypothetical protein